MLILWRSTNFEGRGRGGHKKHDIWGGAQKGGCRQFAGGLAKNKEESVFEGRGS